jgi:hypothetical protein
MGTFCSITAGYHDVLTYLFNESDLVVAFNVLTFGVFVRLFVLASFLVMAALMARSVVPRFLKLMMHLSSQVPNDSTALYDSG